VEKRKGRKEKDFKQREKEKKGGRVDFCPPPKKEAREKKCFGPRKKEKWELSLTLFFKGRKQREGEKGTKPDRIE